MACSLAYPMSILPEEFMVILTVFWLVPGAWRSTSAHPTHARRETLGQPPQCVTNRDADPEPHVGEPAFANGSIWMLGVALRKFS
jgi:hypothetical protein